MVDSVPALLQLIRRSRLLTATQLNEIKGKWLPEVADAQSLADRLLQRGWLTPYQSEQLLEGQDQALVLGPYNLLNLVGEGALGQVFLALHRERRTIVALKVLRPELRTNAEVLHQFWQEPIVLASLAHPAFVQAFDVDPDGAQYYFAMEYIDGIDLGKLLQLAGPLPVVQACDYVRQAALGLQYAYEHGLVHRDIKPSNLLVAFANEQVRILDIGSARREWLAPDGTVGRASGALMGTADYIAPEQTVNPQGADTRADIYSLGCTLYHLLTGRTPFPGGSLARKLLDHQRTPPPPLRRSRSDLPAELEAVVQRMLEKRPANRFQTPALVAVALGPFCRGPGPRLELERFRPHEEATAETLRAAASSGEAAGQEPGTLAEPTPASASRRPGPGEPGFVERRASPRRTGNLVPVLVTDGTVREEPLRGWVLDRSAGGLGLFLGEALEIGTLVRVRAAQPEGAPWVQVRIVHCTPERVRWRVGCQFQQKLSWDVLRFFG